MDRINKWVSGCTCVSVGAVQAGKLNVVLPGICPVYTVIDEVQGQSVGPGDLILYDDTSVGAIHPDPPYMRVVPPVGPVQVPEQRGERDNVPIRSIHARPKHSDSV